MRVNSSTRFAAMAALVGALACAGNTARDADTDEAAAARDTTTSDTLGGQAQNRQSDRGMEGDSVRTPQYPETSDTFLQNQGPGQGQDTSGYSGMERTDTTGQANPNGQTDPAGAQRDTSSMGQDTTSTTGTDTSWTKSGDTTGYNPSQQPQDSVSR
ncbi:MAG: hypothetical protein H0X07_04010 [Gemmatimonadales bacterium]|nr:hypothetical protein [Gemmatimonadales bacterium]